MSISILLLAFAGIAFGLAIVAVQVQVIKLHQDIKTIVKFLDGFVEAHNLVASEVAKGVKSE